MGEYYWRRQYMPPGADESVGLVHMGAFLDEPVHTRLVSYDRVEDLTAAGQVWPDHAVAGNRVWRAIPGQPGMYTPEERADRALPGGDLGVPRGELGVGRDDRQLLLSSEGALALHVPAVVEPAGVPVGPFLRDVVRRVRRAGAK
jgi:hypothetical protein